MILNQLVVDGRVLLANEINHIREMLLGHRGEVSIVTCRPSLANKRNGVPQGAPPAPHAVARGDCPEPVRQSRAVPGRGEYGVCENLGVARGFLSKRGGA